MTRWTQRQADRAAHEDWARKMQTRTDATADTVAAADVSIARRPTAASASPRVAGTERRTQAERIAALLSDPNYQLTGFNSRGVPQFKWAPKG